MNDIPGSILLVEDDENDQHLIARAFATVGVTHHLVLVENGEEAISYLNKHRAQRLQVPGLIVTDLKMPKMGGIDFLAWLQSQEEFRLIPSVVLTSSSRQEDVLASFRNGAKGYMTKPVHFTELVSVVRTIVEYWRTSLMPTRGLI